MRRTGGGHSNFVIRPLLNIELFLLLKVYLHTPYDVFFNMNIFIFVNFLILPKVLFNQGNLERGILIRGDGWIFQTFFNIGWVNKIKGAVKFLKTCCCIPPPCN